MSAAGTFLDVVTIMSGVLMLCVAFVILYNKCPDIVDEIRALIGRPKAPSPEERRRAAIRRVLKDIEAAKQASVETLKQQSAATVAVEAAVTNTTTTPTTPELLNNKKSAIAVECPPDGGGDRIECRLKEHHPSSNIDDDNDDDDYVAKYMAHLATTSFNKSEADSCSVYMDNTTIGGATMANRFKSHRHHHSSSPISTTTNSTTKDRLLNLTPTLHREMVMGTNYASAANVSMDYSLDTADNNNNNNTNYDDNNNNENDNDNKDATSYSSFVKSDYTMTVMESPTATTLAGGADVYPFSFLTKIRNNNITITTNQTEEEDTHREEIAAKLERLQMETSSSSELSDEEENGIGKNTISNKHSSSDDDDTYTDDDGDGDDEDDESSGAPHVGRGDSSCSSSSKLIDCSNQSEMAPTILPTKTPSPPILYGRAAKLTPSPTSSDAAAFNPKNASRSTTINTTSSIPTMLDHSGVPTTIASATISKDSFSPLARRNVTFSSQLLDDSAATVMEDSSSSSSSSRRMRGGRKASPPPARTKPKITIVTNRHPHKEVLILDTKQEEEKAAAAKEVTAKEITPNTVSTTGMWSPSESLTPQAWDDDTMDHRDIESQSVSTGTYDGCYSLPSDESPYERKEDRGLYCSPAAAAAAATGTLEQQDVHVCKSASCTVCRNSVTPKFISTTKPTTGDNYRLPRPLPSRWWDYQQTNYGQLKKYVSSVLLRGGGGLQGASTRKEVDGSMEDHPFDEA